MSSRNNFTDRHEIGEFAKRINYFRLQRADGEDQAHWREEDEKSSAVDTCSHPAGLVQILRVS